MLKLDSITKQYDRFTALDNLSLSVEPGETLVITGPSGSGKTTLLRVIAGLVLPDAGKVYLRGELASQPGWGTASHTRKIGFVFQTSTLWPHMTVAQNILFGLHAQPKPAAIVRMKELLKLAGIEDLEKRYPSQLSGGEARRVELIRAIAPEPDYLLMDEPLTNLDMDNKGRLLDAIREIGRSENRCLMYVTHDQHEAAFLSKNILVMERGRIVT